MLRDYTKRLRPQLETAVRALTTTTTTTGGSSGSTSTTSGAAAVASVVRRLVAGGQKARQVLRAVALLHEAVFALHPLAENVRHPALSSSSSEMQMTIVSVVAKKHADSVGPWFHSVLTAPVLLGTLVGHKGAVTSCCTVVLDNDKDENDDDKGNDTSRRQILVSSSWDGTLRLWDLSTQTEIGTLESRIRHDKAPVTCCCSVLVDVVVDHDSNNNNNVDLESCNTGSCNARVIEATTNKKHKTLLIWGSANGDLKVWDLNAQEELAILSCYEGGDDDGPAVACCAAFVDKQGIAKVICGSDDATLKVWELPAQAITPASETTTTMTTTISYEPLYTLSGHTDQVTCCAVFGNNGNETNETIQNVISGSADGTLKVWNLDKQALLLSLSLSVTFGGINCCTLFDDDTKVACGCAVSPTLQIWDLLTQQEIHSVHDQSHDSVDCCAVYDLGTKVITGGNNVAEWGTEGVIKVHDLAARHEAYPKQSLSGHLHGVSCCALFDNESKLVTGSWDETLKIWALPKKATGHVNKLVVAE